MPGAKILPVNTKLKATTKKYKLFYKLFMNVKPAGFCSAGFFLWNFAECLQILC